jgi:hypothetical protein
MKMKKGLISCPQRWLLSWWWGGVGGRLQAEKINYKISKNITVSKNFTFSHKNENLRRTGEKENLDFITNVVPDISAATTQASIRTFFFINDFRACGWRFFKHDWILLIGLLMLIRFHFSPLQPFSTLVLSAEDEEGVCGR